MGWQSTMTKHGLEILARLGGANPVITAWAGTGTVPPDELMEQAELVSKKQQLAVIEDGQLDNKRYTRVQVVNDNVAERYELNQIGLYVSINENEPVLYYIAQNPDGDIIPANSSVKGFIAEYIASQVYGNGDNIEYDGVVTGFITPDALDTRLKFFKLQMESEYALRTIISDTKPDGQYGIWLKPMGGLILSGTGGGQTGGVGVLNLNGVHFGGGQPDDKGKLWVKPSTK